MLQAVSVFFTSANLNHFIFSSFLIFAIKTFMQYACLILTIDSFYFYNTFVQSDQKRWMGGEEEEERKAFAPFPND